MISFWRTLRLGIPAPQNFEYGKLLTTNRNAPIRRRAGIAYAVFFSTLNSEPPTNMKEEDIVDMEARGFASLKLEAAEKGDIETALEMQNAERESLMRLNDMIDWPNNPEDPTKAADWWKP